MWLLTGRVIDEPSYLEKQKSLPFKNNSSKRYLSALKEIKFL